MWDLCAIYTSNNRARLLVLAAALVIAIAIIDWLTEPYLSLGFLYLFPMMIVGGYLSRGRIIGVAFLCAVLREVFSNLPGQHAFVRLLFGFAGFLGTGLLISEMLRNRRMVLRHVKDLESQIKLRRDAEEELRVLVESSPAAIVTIDASGRIDLANEAAQRLLAPGEAPLSGEPIAAYLPMLQSIVEAPRSRMFRTDLQCTGQRRGGETFLAGIWASTYTTISGFHLAAVMVDLSEDLRNREELSLNYLLKSSRILMSAVAHEIRNLCGAMLVIQKNLSRSKDLEHDPDFHALGTLIENLQNIAAFELRSAPAQSAGTVELQPLLDELRILLEQEYQDAAAQIECRVDDELPMAWADRYGLFQVFLNLAKNSLRAMETTKTKTLRITAIRECDAVVIRFEDSGVGIRSAERLFRPFHSGANSSGLGLYVSRAMLRNFGADLIHEPTAQGCCFAVRLRAAEVDAQVING